MKTEISFLPSSYPLFASHSPNLPPSSSFGLTISLSSFHSLLGHVCVHSQTAERKFSLKPHPPAQQDGKCSSFLHFSWWKSGRTKCRFYYAMDFRNPHFFHGNWPHKRALNENWRHVSTFPGEKGLPKTTLSSYLTKRRKKKNGKTNLNALSTSHMIQIYKRSSHLVIFLNKKYKKYIWAC